MNANLCIHTPGSRRVTVDELEVLPAPVKLGPRHRPVAHKDLVAAIHEEADRRALKIIDEQWGLAANDKRLFGVVEFENRFAFEGLEHGWCFGVRNSVDSSIAIRGVAGTHTFVCDNLALSGQTFVLAHKNTVGVHLDSLIRGAYSRYLDEQERVRLQWFRLSQESLTDEAAKEIIFDAFVEHKVAAVKYLPKVAGEYFRERTAHSVSTLDEHPDTEPRTSAGLLGSFTRVFKDIKSDTVRWSATQKVGKVFSV